MCKKISFPTEAEAKRKAVIFSKKHGVVFYIYMCPVSKNWKHFHISKEEQATLHV